MTSSACGISVGPCEAKEIATTALPKDCLPDIAKAIVTRITGATEGHVGRGERRDRRALRQGERL